MDRLKIKMTDVVIVCICGSCDESHEKRNMFRRIAQRLEEQGKIVLMRHTEDVIAAMINMPTEVEEAKWRMLDELQLCKIEIADELFVLNVGGHIDEDMAKEISFAKSKSKTIAYLEPIFSESSEDDDDDVPEDDFPEEDVPPGDPGLPPGWKYGNPLDTPINEALRAWEVTSDGKNTCATGGPIYGAEPFHYVPPTLWRRAKQFLGKIFTKGYDDDEY